MGRELEVRSLLEKPIVRQRLKALVNSTPHEEAPFLGSITTHQLTIKVRRVKWSLPWAATLRAAIIDRANGTMIIGNFDSNWSLYFVGYPIFIGVIFNLLLNLLAGRATGRLVEFSLFLLAAVSLCALLIWIRHRDQRRIALAVYRSINGQKNLAANPSQF